MATHRIFRRASLGIGAALLLAAVTSIASASRLSSSSATFRVTFAHIEFNAEGLAIVRCLLTLEGSFHERTIGKTSGTLTGAITRALVKQESCTNGIFAAFNGTERYNGTTTPNTLPWHITYEGFTGTLPNIASVNVLTSRFRYGLRDGPGSCTGQYGAATDAITSAASLSAGGVITSLTPVAGRDNLTLARRDGGIFCPNGRTSGTGSVMQLGSTASITITLM